ncbi:MAG: hypothetical protein ABFR19_04225 [Pseudomonadota bacterium]
MRQQTIASYRCETSIGKFFMLKRDDGKYYITHDGRELGTGFYICAR